MGWFIGLFYWAAAVGTTLFLLFFDHHIGTHRNWLVAVPVDVLIGWIWPIYWVFLR